VIVAGAATFAWKPLATLCTPVGSSELTEIDVDLEGTFQVMSQMGAPSVMNWHAVRARTGNKRPARRVSLMVTIVGKGMC
jgi:hypothetical protein